MAKQVPPGDYGVPPGITPRLPPGYKSWEDYWKFKSKLNLQNPMLTMNAPTGNDKNKKQEEDDDEKKRLRVLAIKKSKKKAKGKKTSISSGTGTVSPILYSYPGTSLSEDTSSGGFSFSDIPSIVWIVLAVAGGIFMIKSARK